MAFNVAQSTPSPFKLYALTRNAYDTMVQGTAVSGHSIDENALYLITDDTPDEDLSLNGVFYVDGTSSTTAGTWVGSNSKIKSYYQGLTVAYKVGIAGGSSTTTLNINGLGAVTVKRNDSNLTTHVPVNSVVVLVYDGAYWRWSDYSTSNNQATQYITTTNTEYPILCCYTAATANTTNYVRFATGVTLNPSTKSIKASKVYGAVWNDYAEYRVSDCIEPGRVICENGDDTLSLSQERLQPAGNIISDTFGFAIGETEIAKTPVAISGRVLAYPFEDRNSFTPGDAVCAGPGGTVSKMTREEIIEYPERIIGTVSSIPNYKNWGTGNIEVNNRIWIKVR